MTMDGLSSKSYKALVAALNANEDNSYTGTYSKCLNMGSYNYLGFAENEGPCAQAAQKTTYELGVGICSSRQELGKIYILKALPFPMILTRANHRYDEHSSRAREVRRTVRGSGGRYHFRHGLRY